jgi:DNA (cytosine-5)-methyltransferase 1
MWLTPRAGKTTDENEETWLMRQKDGKVATPPLTLAVRMYPTPRGEDGQSCGAHKGKPDTLTSYMKLWPTPKGSPSGPDFARMNREGSGGDDLATAIARESWPTPSATDGNRGGKMTPNMSGQSLTQMMNSFPTPTNSMVTENDFVQAKFHSTKRGKYADAKFPTPRANEWKGSGPVGSKSHKHMSERNYLCAVVNPTETSGQLNPDWVEWLMLWPIGWTSLEQITELIWLDWSVDPADFGEIPRIATGVKNRVSRLQAIGNGQVPLCFAVSWLTLLNTN